MGFKVVGCPLARAPFQPTYLLSLQPPGWSGGGGSQLFGRGFAEHGFGGGGGGGGDDVVVVVGAGEQLACFQSVACFWTSSEFVPVKVCEILLQTIVVVNDEQALTMPLMTMLLPLMVMLQLPSGAGRTGTGWTTLTLTGGAEVCLMISPALPHLNGTTNT